MAFANPASGTSISSLLRGQVSLSPVPVRATGLPDSAGARLTVGRTRVVTVTVHNAGGAPEAVFLDARLDRSVTMTLHPITPAQGVTLPLPNSAQIPQWIVPTDTTALLGQVDATAPVTFDMSPYLGNFGGELNGDPQVTAASTGDSATATWSDHPVTPGVWNLDPALTGVFGAQGASAQTADLALLATSAAFDPAVRTAYGDFWTAEGSMHPVIVAPGQTVRLYARITPTRAGTVRGTLYVDTLSTLDPFGNAIPAGDQVAALAYRYQAVKA